MGVIYKAEDIKLKRTVALKFLPHALTVDEEGKRRFIQEAQAASALNHPNIITIYEIDEVDGNSFISMEYVDGGNLKTVLNNGQIPFERFLDIVTAVSEGLSKAHNLGIIHRDIKSENILMTSDGRPKITDFGLAKLKGSGTITLAGKALGTAAYMSPEQAQGEELDARSDIFSLGVVFYELLTGQLPFRGMHPMAIMYSIVNEEPMTPSTIRSDIPKQIENVISRTLLKDKNSRYQSLENLLDDFKKLRTGSQIAIEPVVETSKAKAVAVLPFEDLSPNQENEYFANGITDEIITDLSNVASLRVAPRASVMPYKKSPKEMRQIGSELDVEFILQGSVKKFGEKIRVTTQLTSVADGFHLWAEKFDGEMKDIFDIQDNVSRQIVAALKLKISPTEIREIGKKPTANIQAYDFYLKGRDYYFQEGKTNIDYAMRMYEKALEIDPDFALAYTGLGDAYVSKYMTFFDKSTTWLDEAERTCKRALNLDAKLPEAYRALGRVYQFKKNYPQAEEQFNKAKQLKPDFMEAYRSLAWLYLDQGKVTDAVKLAEKALEIRPMDRETYLLLGLAYQDQARYREAIKQYNKAIEISPDYFRAYYHKGQIHQRMGEFRKAIENYGKAIGLIQEPYLYIDLGWCYMMEGRLDLAIDTLKKSIELALLDYRAYYYLGLVYEKKGEKWMAAASYDSAVVLCRRQISEDPDEPLLYSTLSLALTILKKKDEAEEAIQKAVGLGQGNGLILFDLARVYALRREIPKAIKYLGQALDSPLSPTGAEALSDPHFDSIKDNQEFQTLCSSHLITLA